MTKYCDNCKVEYDVNDTYCKRCNGKICRKCSKINEYYPFTDIFENIECETYCDKCYNIGREYIEKINLYYTKILELEREWKIKHLIIENLKTINFIKFYENGIDSRYWNIKIISVSEDEISFVGKDEYDKWCYKKYSLDYLVDYRLK